MITVRISFEKKNEASYISLLDLQRVMQRVLKRSGLPVWHTLGFNPHIYMTFACPLSLGQESECECVDVKTEAEAPDFAQWQTALNAIMPAGIRITHVAPVQMKADLIALRLLPHHLPGGGRWRCWSSTTRWKAPRWKKHGKRATKIVELQGSHPAGGVYHGRG
ncbi:MAG: TIGR03936 family radical SAM-associated protein [Faecalibacterium prausnitzii]